MSNGEINGHSSRASGVHGVAPSILALATAVPAYEIPKDVYTNFTITSTQLPEEYHAKVHQLAESMAIEKRYFCVDEALRTRETWQVLPKNFPEANLSMTKRNELYKREAPKIAVQAAEKAIKEWQGDIADITHIIAVSCTGVMAPGLEYHVIKQLGLSWEVERLGINLMGCFGVFRALSTARAFCVENPNARILIVAVELCSLHFQAEMSVEAFIGNALFADGATSFIVGAGELKPNEHPLWELAKFGSQAVPDTAEHMTWSVSDHGFIMTLSAKVPRALRECTPRHARKMLKEVIGEVAENSGNGAAVPAAEPPLDHPEVTWAIHPGGKAIVDGIALACGLAEWQTEPSRHVLSNYGNMSSVTIGFVLDRILRTGHVRGEYTYAIGFGPGLSLESALLKNTKYLLSRAAATVPEQS